MRRCHILPRSLALVTAVLLAWALPALAQDGAAPGSDADAERPSAGESVLAVVGGDVHTGTGVVYRGGTVLCRGSKILAVGRDLEIPEGARVVDAKGMRVLPGFVVPLASGIGVQRGRPRPGESFGDCLDARSTYVTLAAAAGITCFHDEGPVRGTFGSQNAVLKAAPGHPELMVLKEPAALTVNWTRATAGAREDFASSLAKARAWIDGGRKGRAPVPGELVSAVAREIPVRISASERGDIASVIRLARKHDLRLVLLGATEAWTLPEEIVAAGAIPVISPRERRWPRTGEEDRSGSSIESAGILQKAGARFCLLPPGGFGSGGSGISLGGIAGRDLLTYALEGGFAVRGGAGEEEALRAITLTAAEALGVADRVGSLEKGKDADIVVYQGDPFDFRYMAEVTIVSGRVLYERKKSALFGHLPDRRER